VSLDATVGGLSANSYIDVATATTYFAGRLNATAWDSAVPANREKALRTATARLEQERWLGAKTNLAQALAWPRSGVRNPDGAVGYGYGLGPAYTFFDSASMPTPLIQATCELALSLLAAGDQDPMVSDGLAGVTSLRLGPLTITKHPSPDPNDLPETVVRLLSGLAATGGGTFRIARA
jgi:hypothetical protein